MIRKAQTADRKAIYDLHTAKVSIDKYDSMEFYFARLFNQNRVIVNEIDQHVVASLQVNYHEMMLHDKKLSVSLILGEISKGDSQEYLGQLLEDVLDETSRKTLITLLDTDKPNEFKKYGFKEVYSYRNYILKKGDMKYLSYQGVSKDFTIEDLLKVYKKFTSYFNGYYLRDRDYWVRKYKQLEFLRCGLCVYRNQNNEVNGYMVYHLTQNRLYVDEIVYLNGEALIRLLCYALKMKDEVEIKVSQDEDISKLIPKIKYKNGKAFMARVNDFQLFNRLYESNVMTTSGAFYLNNKSLYLNEWS